MEQHRRLAKISDDELLRRLAELLRRSRRVEADLVEHIGEVDERRLYAREAAPSMFAYCTEVLHLSEAEAYLRIAVARASRKHTVLLNLLSEGRLHLSGIAKLAPFLTHENRELLLARAVDRSKREIQELVAEIAPRRDAPDLVRRLPDRRPPDQKGVSVAGLPNQSESARSPLVELSVGCASDAQARAANTPRVRDPHPVRDSQPTAEGEQPPGSIVGFEELRPDRVGASRREVGPVATVLNRSVVEPLAPGRYKVQFTASSQLREKLERLRSLLRPDVPDGDLAAIVEVAVTEKLERIDARRFAQARHPRKRLSQTDVSPRSRRIPAAVRRAVRERDGSRCAHVDESGRRCPERDRLEYHHRHPFGMGGDHSPTNIALLCSTHNSWLAEHDYGREAIARRRESTGLGSREPV